MKEQVIKCSEHIVLECGCGERVVLLGHREDWDKEDGHLTLTCLCGEKLALADRPGVGVSSGISPV